MQTTSSFSFDPTAISLSDSAKTHVRKQLDLESATGLMLHITESGCNGYMYALKFLDDIPADAKVFEFGDDVKVVVDKEHWDLLRGTHIDLVTEGLNSSLKFENPNADTHCGCGESFSVRGT
ncbi:MAG: iron-sulfur cluster assembly accessory protein [Gammaproteobacteria bacterium]|nr:iron-sulfur cluster assembly accessory protein [Gammaproteobacteria bacterium]